MSRQKRNRRRALMFKSYFGKIPLKKVVMWAILIFFIFAGSMILWVASFELPNIDNFEERQVVQSTKIYDRTGDTILFDVHGDIKRTVVGFDEISDHMKWATVAIEDDNFYNHNGVEPTAIMRAILVNLKNGNLFGGQGGSTITQQVIKNALLTTDKKISRKIKEWFLAPRLEEQLTKEEILEVYLNEVPFGGTVYGIQEAARQFFGKDAIDLTLVESAYLAALPQAPTYYSPFGSNPERLEARKNLVLEKMLLNDFIDQDEYDGAMEEVVEFEKPEEFGIKAAHFVMYIREQLEDEYGKEVVQEGGLTVITTLDYDLQKEAEEIANRWALENKEKYNAENASIVAIDPQTGQILAMVGSRDYFDEEIDGNVNIAVAKRQPGSSIKPIIYSEAFNKGYRPETVVFDVPTEFSVACSRGGNCYSPQNYDGRFRGPLSLREALAQSVNVPAVKVFYLAGLTDALKLAKRMGLTTLTNIERYGLTLVLGGGEVRLLDMASAYSVFANEGVRNEPTGILSIEDREGNILEEFEKDPEIILEKQTALMVSSILSDNSARAPVFGANSALHFPGATVAAKTGTTNDYRDAWIIGFTPRLAISAWAGNNDNTPMTPAPAANVVAPMWKEFFIEAMKEYPSGSFEPPAPSNSSTNPALSGDWQGGGLGSSDDIHSILHFVDRFNPTGAPPSNPGNDPQYSLWEAGIRNWLSQGNLPRDTVFETDGEAVLNILSPTGGATYDGEEELVISARLSSGKIVSSSVYINGLFVGSLDPSSGIYSFIPSKSGLIEREGVIRVDVEDAVGNFYSQEVEFLVE